MSSDFYAPRRILLRLRMDVSPDEVRALIAGNEHEVAMESMMRPPRRLIVILVPVGTEDEWLARYAAHPHVVEAHREEQQTTT